MRVQDNTICAADYCERLAAQRPSAARQHTGTDAAWRRIDCQLIPDHGKRTAEVGGEHGQVGGAKRHASRCFSAAIEAPLVESRLRSAR